MPDPATKAKVFEMLKARGATKAVLHYQGGNDEGGVDDVHLFIRPAVGGEPISVDLDPYSYSGGPDAELVALLEEPIDSKYGSWAGEFSAYGTLTWDAEAGTVVLNDNYDPGNYDSSTEEW